MSNGRLPKGHDLGFNVPLPGRSRPLVVAGLVFTALAAQACVAGAAAPVESGPYEGTELTGPAPDFQLIDQDGDRVSLSDFSDKVVVLTFMDSRCRQVCPLTAIHLVEAARDLRGQASMVIFLGINVNAEANQVSDAAETTRKWGLDEISTWHFLTGDAEDLQPAWTSYHIAVVPAEGGELVHTPGVFLVDQSGELRWYVSTPMDETGAPISTAPLSELLVKHIRGLLAGR